MKTKKALGRLLTNMNEKVDELDEREDGALSAAVLGAFALRLREIIRPEAVFEDLGHTPTPWDDSLSPLIAAGDSRVRFKGKPPVVAGRFLSEENFQHAVQCVNAVADSPLFGDPASAEPSPPGEKEQLYSRLSADIVEDLLGVIRRDRRSAAWVDGKLSKRIGEAEKRIKRLETADGPDGPEQTGQTEGERVSSVMAEHDSDGG